MQLQEVLQLAHRRVTSEPNDDVMHLRVVQRWESAWLSGSDVPVEELCCEHRSTDHCGKELRPQGD